MKAGRWVALAVILANLAGFFVFLAVRPTVSAEYQIVRRTQRGTVTTFEANSASPALLAGRELDLHSGETIPVRIVMLSNLPAILATVLLDRSILVVTSRMADRDRSWLTAFIYLVAVVGQWVTIGYLLDVAIKHARKTAVA